MAMWVRHDLAGMTLDTYSRESFDRLELELAVTRQNIDTAARVEALGGKVGVAHIENDTSAFRKKKVTITDHYGNTYPVWRVLRPVLAEAFQRLRRGEADGLMVDDLDRLARDPRDLEDAIEIVEHYGKTILSASASEIDLTTESGILVARQMVNMANKASRDTSRRLSNAHRHMALSGEPFTGGTRPFGWQEDFRTLHPREAELIRKGIADLKDGVAVNAIANDWNKQGIKTPWGGEWRFGTVKDVLTRPRVAGIRTRRGEVVLDATGKEVEGKWEAIITPDERLALLAILAKRARPRRRKGHYLLGSTLRCGACGGKMWGNAQPEGKTSTYQCQNNGHLSIAVKHAEEAVTLATGMRLIRVQSYWDEHAEEARAAPLPFPDEGRLKELQENSSRMMEDYYANPRLGQLILAQVEKARVEIDDLLAARALWVEEQNRPTPAPISFDDWMESDWATQRIIIEAYCEHVVIAPSTFGRVSPMERVSIVWSEEATPWGEEPAPLLPWESGEPQEPTPPSLMESTNPNLRRAFELFQQDHLLTGPKLEPLLGIHRATASRLLKVIRHNLEVDPTWQPEPPPLKLHRRRAPNSPHFEQVKGLMADSPHIMTKEVASQLAISEPQAGLLMSEVRWRELEAADPDRAAALTEELGPTPTYDKSLAPNSERVAEVVALMEEHPDWSGRKIGRELGLSHTYIYTLMREANVRAQGANRADD